MRQRLLLLLCLVSYYGRAQTDTLLIPAQLSAAPLPVHLLSFIDSTDRLTSQQVKAMQFEKSAQVASLIGFTTHPVWYRFTLKPNKHRASGAADHYVVQITNWYLDEVDLFQQLANGTFTKQQAGDRLPFDQRAIKTRFPAFRIQIDSTTPTTFYLRVRSTQHINLSLNLFTDSAFAESQIMGDSTNFILGLSVMRLIFHLALLLLLFNDQRFRAYSLFGVSVCLIYIFSGGNGNVFFPHSPYWANVVFFVFISFVPVALSYYIGVLFDVPRHASWLVPIGWLIGIICAANLVANLIQMHAYLAQAFIGFFAILLIGIIALSIVIYYRGVRPSIWYLVPLLIYLPPYTLFYIRNAYLHGHMTGFIGGALQESSIRWAFTAEFLFVPFLVVVMLRQAYRDRIKTRQILETKEVEQQQLVALDQLKTRFFTNISHEFRTPLTLLLAPLQDLRTRFPSEEIYVLMQRNAQRLLTLINQLLDLARLDAGQLKPDPQPGDISLSVRLWVASFESLARSRTIKLTLSQNEYRWMALYDADKLEKIVTNLLSNALKFTGNGGEVGVEMDVDQDGMRLRVSDTGVGIAPEDLSIIFNRFYQTTSFEGTAETGPMQQGSGVGLALVHELVSLMQGSIGVTSLLDAGTTFRVWIPVVAVPNHEPAPETIGAPSHKPANRAVMLDQAPGAGAVPAPTLLLVEDNDDLRVYLRTVLSAVYEVREATDGQQGFDIATDWLPDLIVTDLMMPRLDGMALCRLLRQDARTNHIPVVMLTAKATAENRVEGFETGADDYLIKPFVPVELLVRLQNLHNRQQAIRAYCQQQLQQDNNGNTAAPALTQQEQEFLNKLYAQVEQQLAEPGFDVEKLAERMALSSRTLNRKLSALVGMSASEVIRTYRLRQAADLLRQGFSPTDTAYQVGFENPSHFSRAFREYYAETPSAFAEKDRSEKRHSKPNLK